MHKCCMSCDERFRVSPKGDIVLLRHNQLLLNNFEQLSDLKKIVNGYLGRISGCFLQEEEGAMRAS